ncbi:hypothetical protein K7472_31180 [Streptomyces sp. PTM05]|uniref:Secreted protein n=1 Tax=Streptantibioticus parmotrematis TaxID=2873249 RepID=A0ABS7R1D8_9ACTN|nr:hypothetical protein [Streptantibioticus parmotrematis]MBY8889273.1 hypothetical protein [Streptantibioticus parmotrematis]
MEHWEKHRYRRERRAGGFRLTRPWYVIAVALLIVADAYLLLVAHHRSPTRGLIEPPASPSDSRQAENEFAGRLRHSVPATWKLLRYGTADAARPARIAWNPSDGDVPYSILVACTGTGSLDAVLPGSPEPHRITCGDALYRGRLPQQGTVSLTPAPRTHGWVTWAIYAASGTPGPGTAPANR